MKTLKTSTGSHVFLVKIFFSSKRARQVWRVIRTGAPVVTVCKPIVAFSSRVTSHVHFPNCHCCHVGVAYEDGVSTSRNVETTTGWVHRRLEVLCALENWMAPALRHTLAAALFPTPGIYPLFPFLFYSIPWSSVKGRHSPRNFVWKRRSVFGTNFRKNYKSFKIVQRSQNVYTTQIFRFTCKIRSSDRFWTQDIQEFLTCPDSFFLAKVHRK